MADKTQQDKLEALIEQAIENGWRFFEDSTLLPSLDWAIPGSMAVWNTYLGEKLYIPQQVVIFDHDFAKALFGDEKIEVYGGIFYKHESKPSYFQTHQIDAYLYHLQQAVISPDPVNYMYNEVFKNDIL